MATAASSQTQPRILFVDDNEGQRFVFKTQMQRTCKEPQYSCRWDMASSGSEAVDLCTKHTYDIIIMDHNMPNMTGGEAARKIIAMQPAQYIIGFTGSADPREVQDCRAAGMKDVIDKDWNKVMEVLKQFLMSRSLATEQASLN